MRVQTQAAKVARRKLSNYLGFYWPFVYIQSRFISGIDNRPKVNTERFRFSRIAAR